MAMSNCTQTLLADGQAGPASYLMAAGRVTDVDRRPAIGDRQPGIQRRPRSRLLTIANAGPYIRDNRTRTHLFMRSRNPTTARSLLAFAAVACLCSSILYLGSGCAGGAAARNDSALNAYVQGVRAYQSGDTDKA